MSSVTQRIREIKQPRGGYIKPSQFTVYQFEDNHELSSTENVHSSIIGMSVDYLTRFIMSGKDSKAFKIPLSGAYVKAKFTKDKSVLKEADEYLKNIQGLDGKSIINACKLATFDVWVRSLIGAIQSKSATDTTPDEDTIMNIKIMVERCLEFFEIYGPITVDGFTFETEGYTETVDCGDGDFLTADTLWDLKVSKRKPTSENTLQLLMYWIMGQHSEKPEFKGITKLGIFNPRLNAVYSLNISDIPDDIIKTVETEVICY